MVTRRKDRRRMGCDEIPVASFSDIAFLLIIFFILATTLVKTQGFHTEFPQGEKSEEPPTKTTTIQLHDGKLTFNDQTVDLPKLKTALAELKLHKRTGDDKVVLLEASGKVGYQRYFEVMAAITRAGGTICIVREEEGS
jgi:biopolymer transport protein ExbD